jgi:AcrR family transcriptional regulator
VTKENALMQDAPRPGRGRRPSVQVRAEILQAAGRLLLTEGMGAFTIERVAALAGASKMTIYKWWPSKGVLALEGYAATVDSVLAMPDTGDIERDLTAQLLTYVRLLRDTPAGRVIAELVGAAQTDPELAAVLHRAYSGPRRDAGLAALRTAQGRGQIRVGADPEAVIDQLWGACLYRRMMPDRPLTDDFARAVVRNVLDGVRA